MEQITQYFEHMDYVSFGVIALPCIIIAIYGFLQVASGLAKSKNDNMVRYTNNNNNQNNNNSNNNSSSSGGGGGGNKRCSQKFANGNLATTSNGATVAHSYQQQQQHNSNNSSSGGNNRHNASRKSRYNNNNKSNGAYNMQKRTNVAGSDAPWHRFAASSCIEEKFLGQHNPGHRNSTSSEATSEDINSSDEHLNLNRNHNLNLKRNLNKPKMVSIELASSEAAADATDVAVPEATVDGNVATGTASSSSSNKSRSKRQQKSLKQSTVSLPEAAAAQATGAAAAGKTNSGKQCKQQQQQSKWRSSNSGAGNCKGSVNKTKMSLKCDSNNKARSGSSSSGGGNNSAGNNSQQHHHSNNSNNNTKSSGSCSSTSSSALSSPGSSPNSSSSSSSNSSSGHGSNSSISGSMKWQRSITAGEERHHKSQRYRYHEHNRHHHQNQLRHQLQLNMNFLVPPLRQYEHLEMDDETLQQQLQRYLIDPHLLRVYGFPVESVVHEGAIEFFKCLPHMSFAAAHVMAVTEAPLTVINCHDGLNASEVESQEIIEASSSSSSSSSNSSSTSELQLRSASTTTDSGNISPRSLDSESAGDWSGSECESAPGGLELYCNYGQLAERSLAKQCVRCKQDFLVDEQTGQYLTREECSYHWGKYHRCYDGSALVNRWTCCSAMDEAAAGCTRHELHVWTGSVVGLNGPYRDFVHTRPRAAQAARSSSAAAAASVYALDCEMSYTGRGLDVTKVSLVALNGQLVYEHFVRPDADIVDYNTRYSGVTAKDLKSAGVKSLAEVQRDLLQLIDADTILIGHGLDNDLRALRLVHNTLIDTSIAFPHSSGFPYRRALRHLTKTHLNREIQSGDGATGHSSFEDSRACMELMLWRVRHELESDSCSWED